MCTIYVHMDMRALHMGRHLLEHTCTPICTICMHTTWAHVCVYVYAHVYIFIRAQYICSWVCVHCTFHIIYLRTCVCLVHVHSRNVHCAWNGKCKVDNVLASITFSAALVLVRIRVACTCNLREHMCMPSEYAYWKCMMCIGRTRAKWCTSSGFS